MANVHARPDAAPGCGVRRWGNARIVGRASIGVGAIKALKAGSLGMHRQRVFANSGAVLKVLVEEAHKPNVV